MYTVARMVVWLWFGRWLHIMSACWVKVCAVFVLDKCKSEKMNFLIMNTRGTYTLAFDVHMLQVFGYLEV